MKDFGSDKKPLSFDEYEIDSPKLNSSSPNADIEYLLSYITLDENQKINLTQNSFKQETDSQAIPNQILSKYITINSNLETGTKSERQTIVSVIDLGIHLISGIKKLMHKKKLDQQKNKTTLTPLDMFKQLFFGRQVGPQQNQYGTDQFGKRKSADTLIDQMRINSETKILLAKFHQNHQENGEKSNPQSKGEFLLSRTLQERVQQTVKDIKKAQQIQARIKELEHLLKNLEELMQKNNASSIQSEQLKKKLSEIWGLVQTISSNL